MYYLKYNNIDLTQLVKVREVNLPSLPSIEHSEIEMWEMDGNLFSSMSYGNREIEIVAIIQPLDPKDLDLYVNDVKRAFFVREPRPLYLGDETRYLLAVTDGEVEIAELGKGVCEVTVNLIAYSPYWIDKDVMCVNEEGKEVIVYNDGDVPTTPVFDIGIQGDTTFIQLENKNTKERILIGELPRTQKPNIKANENILFDVCQTTSGWVQSQAGIDSGCSTGGTLAVTSTGGGLCIGDFGNGNGTWKGACYRRNLDRTVKDFKVRCNFSFHSAGINGDPTRVEYKDYGGDDLKTIGGGTCSTTYRVKTNGGNLHVRSGPTTGHPIKGKMPNGTNITGAERIENGWLLHSTLGFWGFSSMQYIETIAHDNRWSATLCNFVTNKTTALRSGADEWSSSHCTIPSGTVVRCYIDEHGESTKFRQLNVPYNGCGGYIKSSDLTRASEMNPVKIEYVLEGETADDKEGIIQLYGFSNSGVQLFSMSLIDDSQWYEATYPLIKKNGQDFLYDVKFIEPKAKQKQVESSGTIKYENVLSGTLGYWNDFEGDLYIERVGDIWYSYVNAFNRKFIQSSRVHDTANSNESLGYLVIYVGTSNADKASAMSINEIQVQTATEIPTAQYNIQRFEVGDSVEIDCGVPCVKLNGKERNDLVDIGSQFFDLEVGANEIKIASDNEVNFTALFNKKYL